MKQKEHINNLLKMKPSGFDPNVETHYEEDGKIKYGSWKDNKYQGQFIDERNPWPNEIIIDIDEGDTQNRRQESRKALMVLQDLGLDTLVTDTGGTGFHIHTFFEVPNNLEWTDLRSSRIALYNYLKQKAKEEYNADVEAWDDGVVKFDLTKNSGHLIRAIGGRHQETGHRKTQTSPTTMPKQELKDLEDVEYPVNPDYLRISKLNSSDSDLTWSEIQEKAEKIEEREQRKQKEKLESTYKASEDGLDGLRNIPAHEVLKAFFGIKAEPGQTVKCVVHDSESDSNAKIMDGSEGEEITEGMYGCFGDTCCKDGETVHYHNAIDILLDSDLKDMNFKQVKEALSEEFDVDIEPQQDYRIQNFNMPSKYFEKNEEGNWVEKKSTNLADYTREFAEYTARDLEVVKTVKLDVENNEKAIYKFDPCEKVWKRGGEDYICEHFYNKLPKKHSKNQEKELLTKIHRIDSITLEDTRIQEPELPLQNGILNIEELELRDIEKKDYITSKLPVKFEGLTLGKPEKFLEFLRDSVRSEEDIKKLQEFVGYTLMPWTTKHEKALMLVGPTNSGKSVFLNVVRELLGSDNVAQQSLKDICDTKWALHNLIDTIANIDYDLNADEIKNVGKAKKVISGEPQTVEQKYGQPFDYTPKQKHLYSANETPKVDEDEEAFYDRWITIVFPTTVPNEEQNKDLVDELTTEEEMKKILSWALAGQKRLKKQGSFTGQNGPYAQKELWKEFGDSVEQFVSRYLVTRSQKVRQLKSEDNYDKEEAKNLDMRLTRGNAYSLYEKFAVGTDRDLRKKQALYEQIKQLRGVKEAKLSVNGARERGFKNVELKSDASKAIEDEIERMENAKL